MASRTIRLDEGAEERTRIANQPKRSAFEIYEELDLGPGGYSIAPSAEAQQGVQNAIRRKLKRSALTPTFQATLPQGKPESPAG